MTQSVYDYTVIDFPDENLEKVIRYEIGKLEGNILYSDVKRISYLTVDYYTTNLGEIADLSGIEFCINLTDLSISKSKITDITPLSNLTKLEYLSLSGNEITNISPLSNLTNLHNLYLNNNKIEVLYLNNSQINDISALSFISNQTNEKEQFLLYIRNYICSKCYFF